MLAYGIWPLPTPVGRPAIAYTTMPLLAEHLGSHLRELRQRLVVSLLAVLVCSGVAYAFIEPIAWAVMAPLFQACPSLKSLVYTNLTEAFLSYIKLALVIGVGASLPVLLYQAWSFVAPGLHTHEKAVLRTVVLLASLLFLGGVAFAYFLLLPRLLHFLMGFAREGLQPLPKFGLYLTFMARTALGFGLAFEIPFLMAAVSRTGLVAAGHFQQKRLYFSLVLLALAFVLAAGEPFSALLLLLPLAGLYEIGVVIARVVAPRAGR